jgi:uncharacterized protein (TIGR02996 family)
VEAALIAAIVAAPKMVEPWLAYRDWLVERGDLRGQWIGLALEGGQEVARRPIIPEEGLLTGLDAVTDPRKCISGIPWR